MKYALANSLSTAVSGLDPDAKAYIDAVIAAGATVTATQKNAINTFVKDGKSDGWYSSIKRFYLPIWSIAAPNAIDLISLTSGTFVGSPTYGADSVAFASGAYFNSQNSLSALGLTASSGYIFALTKAWSSGVIAGSGTAGNTIYLGRSSSTNLQLRYAGNVEGSGQLTATGAIGTLGICSASRQGGDRKIYLRKASARSQVATSTSGDFGTPQLSKFYFSAYNNANNVSDSVPVTGVSTLGAFGYGMGLTDAQDSLFTQSLKNLWETCTGSVLP